MMQSNTNICVSGKKRSRKIGGGGQDKRNGKQ
jgi:hypothetical protein